MKTSPGRAHFQQSVRRFFWLTCVLAFVGLLVTLLHAELSEAAKKKRDAFLKAREEMHAVATPTPSASPAKGKPKVSQKKKLKGKKKATADEAATPKNRKSSDEDEATPASKKHPSPEPTEAAETPRRAPVVRQTPAEESRPPRVIPTVAPQTNAPPPADITIAKSGLEEEQGYEPPPPPPPRRGFWARLFGSRESTANYRYLSRGVVDAIRRAPVQRARWKFIIVHNSGTRQGNARAFDYYHRHVRRMQNGLAYHFVVGNGTSSGNGEVEVGDRWTRQINGGHVHSDYLNNISLGICLVGDFNRDHPTRQQLEATEELIKYLRDRCGRVEGRAIPVRPHREMNPPRWSTDCPGDDFPYDWFRRF
ncbi:MAG: N-acetylmuramoyl-L-alanine amidase [Chthoniobacterales bacterium]